MRVTVLHRGVPIGVGELAVDGSWVGGDFAALPGYAAVRPAVRDAQRALCNLGFLPPEGVAVGGVTPVGDAAGRAAIDQARDVAAELELRDALGGLLAHEWVEIWDRAGGFGLMAELRAPPAGPPAVRLRPLAMEGGEQLTGGLTNR